MNQEKLKQLQAQGAKSRIGGKVSFLEIFYVYVTQSFRIKRIYIDIKYFLFHFIIVLNCLSLFLLMYLHA